jgi:hypothetical protein
MSICRQTSVRSRMSRPLRATRLTVGSAYFLDRQNQLNLKCAKCKGGAGDVMPGPVTGSDASDFISHDGAAYHRYEAFNMR